MRRNLKIPEGEWEENKVGIAMGWILIGMDEEEHEVGRPVAVHALARKMVQENDEEGYEVFRG